jgi:hypothetical protein
MNAIKYALPLLLLLTGACATTNPPTQQLTETETVIRQAGQIGAVIMHRLNCARQGRNWNRPVRHITGKIMMKRHGLAEQAKVDAELAQIKTLSGKAQLAVRELRESIRVLQEELEYTRK